MQRDPGLANSVIDDLERPISMVLSGVAGQETLAWRGDVGVPDVREHRRRAVDVVFYDPCTQFIGRAFEAEGKVCSICDIQVMQDGVDDREAYLASSTEIFASGPALFNRARPEQVYCFVLNASQAKYYGSTGPVSRVAQHFASCLVSSTLREMIYSNYAARAARV